jgi:hypothetical protein
VDALVGALAQQVLARLGEWMKSRSETRVGDDPVDLLGHRAVEAAQAGLDVADRICSLAAHERAASVELTSPGRARGRARSSSSTARAAP